MHNFEDVSKSGLIQHRAVQKNRRYTPIGSTFSIKHIVIIWFQSRQLQAQPHPEPILTKAANKTGGNSVYNILQLFDIVNQSASGSAQGIGGRTTTGNELKSNFSASSHCRQVYWGFDTQQVHGLFKGYTIFARS